MNPSLMNRLQRLFHEPPDPEVAAIKTDLKTEKLRHSRELSRVERAIADLGAAYERAEQDRKRLDA